MATHSRILSWRILWTEEPGQLQSMGHKESDMTEWLSLHFISLTCFFLIGHGGGVGPLAADLLKHWELNGAFLLLLMVTLGLKDGWPERTTQIWISLTSSTAPALVPDTTVSHMLELVFLLPAFSSTTVFHFQQPDWHIELLYSFAKT